MAATKHWLVSILVHIFACWVPARAQDAYYPLNYADSSMLPGSSQECLDAFNANVSCNQAIGSLYANLWPNLDQTILDALCTSTCFDSLQEHRSTLISSCGSDVTYYSVSDGSTWPVTYLTDKAIYGYNLTCLKRSDEYCNLWFQDGVNEAENPECDECYLKTAYIQAVSPIDSAPEEMQSIYASMSSSCGYDGPPATMTVEPLLISSPTATAECASQYVVQTEDTYLSVSVSQGVATHDLITANGLDYSLADFPTSGTLCIRNQCTVYVIQDGDTCRSISDAKDISQASLRSWNPFINGLCNNIGVFVGQTMCLTNPLGEYSLVNNTDSATYMEPAEVPSNVAPTTTTNCGLYHEVQAGEDCGTVEVKYGISLDDFIFLNPMVEQNCTNLWADTSYCVAPVGEIEDYPGYAEETPDDTFEPQETTEIEYVDPWVESGDYIVIPLANNTRDDCWEYFWWNDSLSTPNTCWEAAQSNELSNEQFVLWNPSLDQNEEGAATKSYDYDCTLALSVSYCRVLASPTPATAATAVPVSPRAAGEISGCTRWFPAVLSCDAHLSLLRMPFAWLYECNPSVGADCSGFVKGTYYCYSTSEEGSYPHGSTDSETATTTTTSATSTTSTGVATPTPTQSGMVSDCTSFYKVVSGDGCWAIANDHGISLDELYEWNPSLGSDCSALWPDYYVCIGVGGDAAATTTSVATTATSTATTSLPTATSNVSTDGTCGTAVGDMTCAGSAFGDCCSSSGYCGSDSAYCGSGCQTAFGVCDEGGGTVSPDGTCGGDNAYTCAGSQFGSCCSQWGYCGSSSDYCGTGCQSDFGTRR